MKWSYPIARVSGIELKVHATFLLLLVFVAWMYWQSGGAAAALFGVAFILLLFLCVLLHEFGHAFAARYFGIRTPDITLLPIGGVARLERMPENPMQELIVAVAGPAVNVVIAMVLWFVLGMPMGQRDLLDFEIQGGGLAQRILQVNVMLVVFNLIPAFPMDGGRILRALLGMKFDHQRATMVAARVGQVIAVGFVIVGFFDNLFLIFIGLFVFSGAQQELRYAKFRSAVAQSRVSDAMISRFQSFAGSVDVADAAADAAKDSQPIFPVTDDRLRVTGMVSRKDLLARASEGRAARVSEIARVVPTVPATAGFGDAFALMQSSGNSVLPVVNPGGQVVGLVSLQLLSRRTGVASA
ncbi:MAG: site-2 protease family protein [Chthoniobacterales bacterium]